MAKGSKSDQASMERAETAKNQLVSQYLHLGSAMKRCSAAVEAYATALNDATTNEEILALLRAPVAQPMPTGMPEMMPFLTIGNGDAPAAAAGGKAGTSKKRAASDASDDVEVDANGKKKRKSKKKPVDPDAPKRPPSAYILFQNAIRQEMKEKNPDIPYQEILIKTGTAWKELGEEAQAPYKEAATQAMASYKAEHADYVANGKPDPETGDVSMVDELAATPAAAPAEEKKEKAPKKEKKEKAPAAAAKPAKPVSESKEPAAKKEKKAPASKAAPAPAPSSAVTSTPAVKNAVAPKPVSASTKKNVPQAAAESSSSGSESDDDDDSDSSSEEED